MRQTTTQSKKLLMHGTMILSLAAIFTKILSAIYRVPFQNIVGDIGFYIYQQVYPFYGIAMTFATYGFPVIISKLYAEKQSLGETEEAELVLPAAFLSISLFASGLFFVTFLGADFMALQMGDEKLSPLIRFVSFSFLVMPFTAVLRGYFQGKGNMVPTAVSQIGEQFIRVSFILIGAIFLVQHGFHLYHVGSGAFLASVLGSICGALILLWFFSRDSIRNVRRKFHLQWQKIRPLIGTIFFKGIAICLSSLTLLLFQLSDAFQILSLLVKNGMQMIEAQTMKGIYDRGQPLMQLGLVIATSLSLSIVPMVTVMKNKQKDIEEYCRLSFQISLGVSSAATVGLLLIMSPVNTMLFQTDAGSHVLRVLSIAILFASLCTTIIAILQGLDIIFYPAFIVLFGWLMKTIFNQLCIQQWGVYGAALATICSLAIMLLLLVRKLHKTMNIPLVSGRFIKGLGLSLVTMTVILVILSQAFEYFFPFTAGDRLVSSILSILLTIIGCVVFAGMIVYSDALSNEELALMPFGNKLKSFRRGRK